MLTHNLVTVAGVADRVAVAYAGRLVETAGVERLFATPAHPYARGLLASLPRVDRAASERRLLASTSSHPR